jgi:hypothetical protein
MSLLDHLKKKEPEAPQAEAPRQYCRFIEHKGVEVLLTDFSGVAGVWYIRAVNKAVEFVRACGKSDLRMLYDVTDTRVFDGALPTLKQAAADTKHLVFKRAVFGVTEVQMVFLKGIAAFTGEYIRAFGTREEALDWLAEG